MMVKIPLSVADVPGVNSGDSGRELVNQASSSMARARIGEPETTLRHTHGSQLGSALNTKRDNKITTQQRYVQGNPTNETTTTRRQTSLGCTPGPTWQSEPKWPRKNRKLRNPLTANRKKPVECGRAPSLSLDAPRTHIRIAWSLQRATNNQTERRPSTAEYIRKSHRETRVINRINDKNLTVIRLLTFKTWSTKLRHAISFQASSLTLTFANLHLLSRVFCSSLDIGTTFHQPVPPISKFRSSLSPTPSKSTKHRIA